MTAWLSGKKKIIERRILSSYTFTVFGRVVQKPIYENEDSLTYSAMKKHLPPPGFLTFFHTYVFQIIKQIWILVKHNLS